MLGKIIRYMRQSSGFSQETLAEKTKIAQSTISGYETSFSIPNYRELEKIANACDFEIIFRDKNSGEVINPKNIK